MELRSFKVRIRGYQPLLMHATTGLDPRHPLRKRASEITAKRGQKKTDSDLEELDWIDFRLSLYYDEAEKRVVVPDSWLLGCTWEGAKARKMGKEALAGIETTSEFIPLLYDGPRDPKGLYEKKFVDRRPVRVEKARVFRCRPRFNEWQIDFSLLVDDSLMNPENVKAALDWGGHRKGIGDFRPRFGRFEVEQWEEVENE